MLFKAGRTGAQLVLVLLVIDIAIYLINIILGFSQISLFSRVTTGQSVTPDQIAANDSAMQSLEIPLRLAQIITAIFFLIWIYRSNRNLRTLEVENLEYSPGWAVGGFFVPVLNLIHPYQVVKEIWEASSPEVSVPDDGTRLSRSTPLLPGFWWGAFLLMNLLGQAVLWLSPSAKTAEAFLPVAWLSIISFVVGIIAAVFALLIVRGIDQRQRERALFLSEHHGDYVTKRA